MAGKTVSPAGFAAALRRLAKEIPQGVERAMDDAALELQGSLVQNAIGSTTPHQPVDRAQYKGGWRKRKVKGGAVVYNATKQALWIERGRGPGPVPLKPLIAWVKRKGLATGGAGGGKKRDGKGRFLEAPEVLSMARAIQRKIMKRGIKPRWVLRRAVLELQGGRLGAAIARQLRGLRP